MPTVIGTPRFRQFLNRLFASKRSGSQELQALDDVFPTIALADPAQDEHHAQRSEVLWAMGGQLPAYGAGRQGWLTVRNASDSKLPFLIVIEHIYLTLAAAGTVIGGLNDATGFVETTAKAPVQKHVALWTGYPSVPQVIGGLKDNATPPPNTGLWLGVNNFGWTDVCPGESWIFGPGVMFEVGPASPNVSMDYMIEGYVRPMDQGEIYA